MTDEVTDLRKDERFEVQQPLDGTFGNVEVTLLNLALSGVQFAHALPLRLGTRARLVFRRGDVSVSIPGRVVWSQLSQTPKGLLYRSGVQLDSGEVHYASGLHNLLRSGVLARDTGSLERKRLRELEREKRKTSSGHVQIPPPTQ